MRFVTVIILAIFILSFFWFMPNPVRAGSTPVTTDCPSAENWTYDNFYNSWTARYREGGFATSHYVAGDDMFLVTGDYKDETLFAGWDAQEMPPDNATIIYVWMVVRAKVAEATTPYDSWGINLTYATNETAANVTAGTALWTVGDDKTVVANSEDGFEVYVSNITTNETWTAPMLKSNLTWVNASIPIIWTEWEPDARLYIDYIGLRYVWCLGAAPGPPDEGGDDYFDFGVFNVGLVGGLGMVGFVGMIATPALAVWFWRREQGSKIMAAIGALVVFMVCFTLFLGSLEA